MLFHRALSLLITSATIHQCVADDEASANELPILLKQEFSTVEYGALEKRDTCPGGGRCLIGTCCGDGCASNCCGHDEGGVGCGIAQRCQFDGNVFIGCCANLIGGCTGTPTRVTINTPYRTVNIRTDDDLTTTYAPAITSESGVTTDVDSSSSTATAAFTRTTSTSASSIDDISVTTAIESPTRTSTDFDLTTETTSFDAATTSSSDFGSDSFSTGDLIATASETASDEEATASNGAAGRSFGGIGMGSLLALGAWFLGTA